MSLLFCDGFDHYTLGLGATPVKWDSFTTLRGSTYDVNSGWGRPSLSDTNTGGVRFQAGNGFGAGAPPFGVLYKNMPVQVTTGFVGFAFKVPSALGAQDSAIVAFEDAATVQVALWLSTTGTLYFTRGYVGTVLGSASINALSVGNWYYIEVKVVISGTVGVAIVRVNGTSTGWVSLTGQNTKSTANSYFTRVGLGSYSNHNGNGFIAATTYMDDLYICDDQGSRNNTFIGDVRVNGLLPSGNGTLNQWSRVIAAWPSATAVALGRHCLDSNGKVQVVTAISGTGTTGGSAPTWNTVTGGTTTDNAGANQVVWTNKGAAADYLAVNDIPTPDSDSSYLASATVGEQTRFTYPSIAGSSIKAVVGIPFSDKDDAGARSIRFVALSGGTLGDNGADLTEGGSYSYQEGILETDPNTGVDWTAAGVNAAEFGVKVIT